MLALLVRSLRDTSPVMKEAVARALGAVLEADYLEQQNLRATPLMPWSPA